MALLDYSKWDNIDTDSSEPENMNGISYLKFFQENQKQGQIFVLEIPSTNRTQSRAFQVETIQRQWVTFYCCRNSMLVNDRSPDDPIDWKNKDWGMPQHFLHPKHFDFEIEPYFENATGYGVLDLSEDPDPITKFYEIKSIVCVMFEEVKRPKNLLQSGWKQILFNMGTSINHLTTSMITIQERERIEENLKKSLSIFLPEICVELVLDCLFVTTKKWNKSVRNFGIPLVF
jgi:hypothetical protein